MLKMMNGVRVAAIAITLNDSASGEIHHVVPKDRERANIANRYFLFAAPLAAANYRNIFYRISKRAESLTERASDKMNVMVTVDYYDEDGLQLERNQAEYWSRQGEGSLLLKGLRY